MGMDSVIDNLSRVGVGPRRRKKLKKATEVNIPYLFNDNGQPRSYTVTDLVYKNPNIQLTLEPQSSGQLVTVELNPNDCQRFSPKDTIRKKVEEQNITMKAVRSIGERIARPFIQAGNAFKRNPYRFIGRTALAIGLLAISLLTFNPYLVVLTIIAMPTFFLMEGKQSDLDNKRKYQPLSSQEQVEGCSSDNGAGSSGENPESAPLLSSQQIQHQLRDDGASSSRVPGEGAVVHPAPSTPTSSSDEGYSGDVDGLSKTSSPAESVVSVDHANIAKATKKPGFFPPLPAAQASVTQALDTDRVVAAPAALTA